MRIPYFFRIIFTIICIGLFSYNFSYAACIGTFDGDAASFLQGCANTSTNIGIMPVTDGADSVQSLIVSVSEKVIAFGALFAIGAIVFSGIQYTTAYGDDEKVKKAKMTGIYALT